ncbi:Fic family protein [bacterium]|jgi:Fic family protein|nr:Fic family protein [Verrucomicrobiota bacterium]MDA7633593.1 Fic family protein [bacterium]MDA7667525.1 Fic family protein [bacterium]MDA7680177.1 Fic family protein [bacterium]MDB4745805.1 Fic family protein [Verrucomicrobiota bacterium]
MLPFEPERLPPEDLNYIALMPSAGAANRSISTLNGLLYALPNHSLLISPLTTQEAVLSSKIEGTQANLQDVLKFDAGESPPDQSQEADIHEIINYRQALRASKDLLKEKPFCINTLLYLHKVLMSSVRGADKTPGNLRSLQNGIGTPNSTIAEAAFVPPSPLHLQDHMNKWEAYWHAETPDLLIQLALAHAQFEAIHPFMDGNGRIGRMIIPLFLYENKLLSEPCFYLSAYLEKNKEEYIQRLRNLGKPNSWTEWCIFFLEGVRQQAEANTSTAKAVHDLYEKLKTQLLDLTHSQYAVPILDHMFENPVFSASSIYKRPNMPTPPTISNMLKTMKDRRILATVREGAGRRPQVLALTDLINLCEGQQII